MNETKADKAFTELKRLLIGGFNEINVKLEVLKSDVSTLKSDVSQLKDDVSQLKRDVNTLAKDTGHSRDKKGQLRKTA